METFVKDLSEKLMIIELSSQKNEEIFAGLEKNLEKYIEKARDTLKKKHIINPKPQKRFARIVESGSEDEAEHDPVHVEFKAPPLPVSKPPENVVVRTSSDSATLRPVRSAKINASKNLKEQPSNLKMRNDNNISVIVKTERVSVRESGGGRDSLKENAHPLKASEDKTSARRSQSVEIIPTKPVEIDITHDDSDRMPPPILPPKQKKKGAKKVDEIDPSQPLPLRVTRSKIKKEKVSISKTQSETIVNESNSTASVRKSQSDQSVLQKTIETSVGSSKPKKKYPMPILIKIERTSEDLPQPAPPAEIENVNENVDVNVQEEKEVNNETFNLPNPNQTVTISPAAINNETVTIEPAAASGNVNETVTLEKNPHDSLMTEDNDEEDNDTSMDAPLSQLKNPVAPNLPTLKLKKNEVFNPFMASPVKKKVEAFEKHAIDAKTPEKGKTAGASSTTKYSTLKAGTPSKIALYSTKGTTPMSNAKQKYIAAVSSASSTSSSNSKKSVQKKFSSISNENQEEIKKIQTLAQLEEKKRQREEKQRQVQLQREAIEKQKREQTLLAQKEREEKFKKIMQEKEEQKRLEAQKKKALKEQQERKFAEERARKEELAAAAAVQYAQPPSASKDDSLYYKMQKQIMAEKQMSAKKAEMQKKAHDKNEYGFDMLNTDDSTDDEGKPSKKRPIQPAWCKKPHRKKVIHMQSYVNPELLDTLFSVKSINVDLRAIFPRIEASKLVRNSSAVWRTPPRYSVYAKDLSNHH